jgi:hypothetical protein
MHSLWRSHREDIIGRTNVYVDRTPTLNLESAAQGRSCIPGGPKRDALWVIWDSPTPYRSALCRRRSRTDLRRHLAAAPAEIAASKSHAHEGGPLSPEVMWEVTTAKTA